MSTLTNTLPVTVTVTETYCGAGECPTIAARQDPSNGPDTTNALSILSSAYLSAISAYTSAQATDSSLPSLTFVPELFSSYGETQVGATNQPSSPTAAPSDSTVASSNPTSVENSQNSAATSTAPVSLGSPSENPSSYGGVTTTTDVTTTPAETAPASEASSGESTANPAETSGTAAVPVPVPSSITDSSAISSYVSSVQSSLSSEATEATANPASGETTSGAYTASPTESQSEGASTTKAPSSSATHASSSSSSQADAASGTSATTTEAPPAEQTNSGAGINQLPVAMGGLAAAMAGMLFI
jgi:hypothetical protein